MEKLLNEENVWDGITECEKVERPSDLITEVEVAKALKAMKSGKAAGPTGVVAEMLKEGTYNGKMDDRSMQRNTC